MFRLHGGHVLSLLWLERMQQLRVGAFPSEQRGDRLQQLSGGIFLVCNFYCLYELSCRNVFIDGRHCELFCVRYRYLFVYRDRHLLRALSVRLFPTRHGIDLLLGLPAWYL